MTDGTLQAWCNGYECVAARTKDEARTIVKALDLYEDEDLDGDGWYVIPSDEMLWNDDGTPGCLFGELLAESDEPRHLYSCEV